MFKPVILTLFMLLTALSLAQPQGEFIVGKTNGEDFKLLLSFDKSKVLIETFNQQPFEGEAVLQKLGESLYHFVLPFPEENQAVTLIQSGPDTFILSSPKESQILRGHKVQSTAHDLNGNWQQIDGEGKIVFEDSTILLMNQQTQIYPIKKRGPIYRAVLVKQVRPEDSILLNFAMATENTLLVWDEEDGDVKRFSREE